MARRPADPEARQRWRKFLRNHREILVSKDFLSLINERRLHRRLSEVVSHPRLGGLHHRCERRQAA